MTNAKSDLQEVASLPFLRFTRHSYITQAGVPQLLAIRPDPTLIQLHAWRVRIMGEHL